MLVNGQQIHNQQMILSKGYTFNINIYLTATMHQHLNDDKQDSPCSPNSSLVGEGKKKKKNSIIIARNNINLKKRI